VKATTATMQQQLKEYLSLSLPQYMIPSSFIIIDTLPLSPSGKLDIKSLPKPNSNTVDDGDDENNIILPSTREEVLVHKIWCDVLGFTKMSTTATLFDVGGDSILALQIVRNMKAIGIDVTIQDLMHNPTIQSLCNNLVKGNKFPAATASSKLSLEPVLQQQIVVGEVLLTPIQKCFFSWNLAKPNHFNQSTLIQLPHQTTKSVVERIFCAIVRHHDSLRLRFSYNKNSADNVEVVSYYSNDLTVCVGETQIPQCKKEQQQFIIKTRTKQLQQSLDLVNGPIIQAELFTFQTEQQQSNQPILFVVVHHLAVDWISWGIIYDDLFLLFEQIAEGKEQLSLPPKTTTYSDWSKLLLQQYLPAIQKTQLEYWENVAIALNNTCLPTDNIPTTNNNSPTSEEYVVLSEELTTNILKYSSTQQQQQRSHIVEVLLTAVLVSLEKWRGVNNIVILLDNFGREQDCFNNVDTSRTVGWFTTTYPVHLKLPQTASTNKTTFLQDVQHSVQQQLSTIPDRGLAYGVLKYLTTALPATTSKTRTIQFNYLGSFDSKTTTMFFHDDDNNPEDFKNDDEVEDSGDVSQENALPFGVVLHLSCCIVNGKLRLWFNYNNRLFLKESIQLFVDIFKHCINEITHSN